MMMKISREGTGKHDSGGGGTITKYWRSLFGGNSHQI